MSHVAPSNPTTSTRLLMLLSPKIGTVRIRNRAAESYRINDTVPPPERTFGQNLADLPVQVTCWRVRYIVSEKSNE